MPIIDPTCCMLKASKLASFSGRLPSEHVVQKMELDTKRVFRKTDTPSIIDAANVANSGMVGIIDSRVAKPNQLVFVTSSITGTNSTRIISDH